MEVIHQQGDPEVATAYLARFDGDEEFVEFVDSLGGAGSRKEKWAIVVSSLFGCPMDCRFCDAGHFYRGELGEDELMEQIEYVIGEGDIEPDESDKFKGVSRELLRPWWKKPGKRGYMRLGGRSRNGNSSRADIYCLEMDGRSVQIKW